LKNIENWLIGVWSCNSAGAICGRRGLVVMPIFYHNLSL
jgi:hypothetical protein